MSLTDNYSIPSHSGNVAGNNAAHWVSRKQSFSITEETEGWITQRGHPALSWGSYYSLTSHFLSPWLLEHKNTTLPLSLLSSVVIPLLVFSCFSLLPDSFLSVSPTPLRLYSFYTPPQQSLLFCFHLIHPFFFTFLPYLTPPLCSTPVCLTLAPCWLQLSAQVSEPSAALRHVKGLLGWNMGKRRRAKVKDRKKMSGFNSGWLWSTEDLQARENIWSHFFSLWHPHLSLSLAFSHSNSLCISDTHKESNTHPKVNYRV